MGLAERIERFYRNHWRKVILVYLLFGVFLALLVVADSVVIPLGEPPRTQVSADIAVEHTGGGVKTTAVDLTNADYVTINYTGWGGSARASLSEINDSVTLSTSGFKSMGNASITHAPEALPREGDVIQVSVTAFEDDVSTVVVDQEFRLEETHDEHR